MKTEIINALLDGKSIQVNMNPLNIDSKNYWIDLDPRNKDHHHLYASLFTINDAYPIFRIKPESKIITYKMALLRHSEDYWIFTVNSHERAEFLENARDFVKWITHWKTYNVEDNYYEK